MRHATFASVVAIAMFVSAPGARAGGYTRGTGSGSCSFTPGKAMVGQSFSVHAAGLPTDVEVDLIVTNYKAATSVFGPLAVNAAGTWSGSFAEPSDGWWNFDFASPSTNSLRLANLDASCKIQIHGIGSEHQHVSSASICRPRSGRCQ
jgi:hypothetical protein